MGRKRKIPSEWVRTTGRQRRSPRRTSISGGKFRCSNRLAVLVIAVSALARPAGGRLGQYGLGQVRQHGRRLPLQRGLRPSEGRDGDRERRPATQFNVPSAHRHHAHVAGLRHSSPARRGAAEDPEPRSSIARSRRRSRRRRRRRRRRPRRPAAAAAVPPPPPAARRRRRRRAPPVAPVAAPVARPSSRRASARRRSRCASGRSRRRCRPARPSATSWS